MALSTCSNGALFSPTDGHLSFLAPHAEMANTVITANIIFILFMVLYLWRQIMREGNHFLINDELHSKIAFLTSINKERRQFVASSKFKNEAPFLMEQIICQRKAKEKLPFMNEKKCFYTQKALMQATHHQVAAWKAKYISSQTTSNTIISLTAGLGADDYFLSQHFTKVVSIDLDPLLHEISLYNNQKLGIAHIERHNMSCQDYLVENPIHNGIIYLDPDRQAEQGATNKNVALFSPNIIELTPALLNRGNVVFIKLSGVTDLDWIRANVPMVSEIHIISLENEVKEILLKLEKSEKNIPSEIFVTELFKASLNHTLNKVQIVDMKSFLNQADVSSKYIFHPHNAIIKSNLLRDPNLCISPNTQFFHCDDTQLSDFGQLYRIDEVLNMSLKQLKKQLKSIGLNKATIIARNSSLNSNAAKSFLQMKENSSRVILIFGNNKSNTIYITSRV